MAKIPNQLLDEWRVKLKESGFQDIEDQKGNLKQPNKRSVSFSTQDITREFFSLVDQYILQTPMNRLEKKILELYSEGKPWTQISLEVYRSESYVKKSFYKHRDKILGKKTRFTPSL